jgi:hypothetical protein
LCPLLLFLAFIGFLWPLFMQSSHYKNHAIYVDSILVVPLGFRLLLQSSLPTRLPWEPSYLKGLGPGGAPWLLLSFLFELAYWAFICLFYDGFCLFNMHINFYYALLFHYLCYCLNISIFVFLILVYISSRYFDPINLHISTTLRVFNNHYSTQDPCLLLS